MRAVRRNQAGKEAEERLLSAVAQHSPEHLVVPTRVALSAPEYSELEQLPEKCILTRPRISVSYPATGSREEISFVLEPDLLVKTGSRVVLLESKAQTTSGTAAEKLPMKIPDYHRAGFEFLIVVYTGEDAYQSLRRPWAASLDIGEHYPLFRGLVDFEHLDEELLDAITSSASELPFQERSPHWLRP